MQFSLLLAEKQTFSSFSSVVKTGSITVSVGSA